VHIEDHVIFGPEVAIMTDMHNFKDAEMLPYDRVELLKPVTIERCVWIGMRAIIMPGVRVGEGSIVGAGAVVTKSCEPGSILAGNPARVIGKRDMEHYRALVKEEQFYLMLKQKHNLEKTLVPMPEAEAESRS
jgi:acetyltransferase-like isoleucine patch superfamily enzyme